MRSERKRKLEEIQEYERRISFDEELFTCLDVAKEKLYPGSKLTVLAAIYLKLRTFVSHPYSSKAELSELFSADKHFNLPKGNKMPGSFDEALKLIKPFLIPLENYDVCINDFHRSGLSLLLDNALIRAKDNIFDVNSLHF